MKIPDCLFTLVNWADVAPTEHPGDTGKALWRTQMVGDIRIRVVDYLPGYLGDHWCDRGHILFVAEGELTTELRDGGEHRLISGMSFLVSDFGDAPHRTRTTTGAKVFIVD